MATYYLHPSGYNDMASTLGQQMREAALRGGGIDLTPKYQSRIFRNSASARHGEKCTAFNQP